MRAGRIYLAYTLVGGAALLLGTAWLYSLTGTLTFREQGFLAGAPHEHHATLQVIFGILIVGLGVKAALVPLHGWLPQAMVAPAPVSALLHAVAVVKAGAFGIVRVVSDVYGIEFSDSMGLLVPLALAAAVTIIYGSLRALWQDDLKRRLAFSTVSQVSYIALGLAMGTPTAALAGIVHLVHQGVMKITLFFAAGNLAETLGVHRISEMDGVARRMPWTMVAFTVGALGMIGVPPLAGFVSKWYLSIGALEAGKPAVILVLVTSSLLNAAYFLPIVYRAWFKPPAGNWDRDPNDGGAECGWSLLGPPLATASLALAAGLFANWAYSPLSWARLITLREFGL
jgi:multicomponent Na+:H+ antiporter subunit D